MPTTAHNPFWEVVQSPLVATIVGGLVVALVVWLITVVVARVRRVRLGELLTSAACWVRDTRPVTVRRLRREVAEARSQGYKDRDDAVAIERRSPSPPVWRLNYDAHMGRDEDDNDVFWLTNVGFPVTEVEVTADPELVLLPRRVVFTGIENGTGQGFAATITDVGRERGITLQVSWRNRYGDPGSEGLKLSAEQVSALGIETRPQAYGRGKADGFAEGLESGIAQGRLEIQNEINAARVIPVAPIWSVERWKDSQRWRYRLTNYARGSTAFDVRLSVEQAAEFSFRSDVRWNQIHGLVTEEFDGLESRASRGVHFTVSWSDQNGDRHSEPVFLDQRPTPAPRALR